MDKGNQHRLQENPGHHQEIKRYLNSWKYQEQRGIAPESIVKIVHCPLMVNYSSSFGVIDDSTNFVKSSAVLAP